MRATPGRRGRPVGRPQGHHVKRICTVCARGGSKGVPGKNTRMLLGKPLIVWTLEQARESAIFDLIAVSSDAPATLETARDHGADVLIERPTELASDQAGKPPAIAHCVERAEAETGLSFDVIVDLDVTSPLRLPGDVQAATTVLEQGSASNLITGAPARHSPYFNLVERDAEGHVRLSKRLESTIHRRQDAPACFDLNGSIYVWRREPFLSQPAVFYEDTLLYEMPAERSVDIDSELDFDIVELLMRRRLA